MNNNLVNNNNSSWIGSTHIDNYKMTSNFIITTSNLLENHSSNYTSNISNILENHSSNYTSNTSNLLEQHSSNYTIATSNYFSKLINNQIEHITLPPTDIVHTYITNSNLAGEIRFWCYTRTITPTPIPNENRDYQVKINALGKLFCYYTYDPLIALTIGSQWLDVPNSIVGLMADSINQGTLITGVEAQVQANYNTLENQILALTFQLEENYIIDSGVRATIDRELSNVAQTNVEATARLSMNSMYSAVSNLNFSRITQLVPEIVGIINYRISQNAVAGFALGIGGAIFSIAYGAQQSANHDAFLSTIVANSITSNSNLTSNQKQNLLTSNDYDIANNVIDRIVSYYKVFSNQGFVNSNIDTPQTIRRILTNEITYNGSNISNVFLPQTGGTLTGLLTGTTINAVNGLQENAIYLDSKYLQLSSYDTNRKLQNDTTKLNYGIEKKYPPPRIYNSSTVEAVSSFLNQNTYIQTITINDYINGYGIGDYVIYSSSSQNPTSTDKKYLFNNDYIDSSSKAIWADLQYTSKTYTGSANIKTGYNGEWIVIKLPSPILLTRFRFWCGNVNFAPALWRCYGSMDGINFNEIQEAEQTTTLFNTSYNNNYYEKALYSSFTTPYQYIGFVIQKVIGNVSYLSFSELELYGKELYNPIYNYVSSNVLNSNLLNYPSYSNILTTNPNIQKKFAFSAVCATSITLPNTQIYYKYDIDLTKYTQLKYTTNSSSPYRIFNIKCFLTTCYFEYFTNNIPNILSYEIYMCNQATIGTQGQSIGINICALGFPQSYKLDNVIPTKFGLCRTADFNYISVISTIQNLSFTCVIEDILF